MCVTPICNSILQVSTMVKLVGSAVKEIGLCLRGVSPRECDDANVFYQMEGFLMSRSGHNIWPSTEI